MRTLTDLEMLALLCAAPVDVEALAGNVRCDHATPGEHAAARDLLTQLCVERRNTMRAGSARMYRTILARVYGLPERAPGDDEPIVMGLAWESEPSFARMPGAKERIDAMLDTVETGVNGSTFERIAALCAEVRGLREIVESGNALLRVSTAALETETARRMVAEDVPAAPLYKCAGPSCPGYPYTAPGAPHPASCGEVKS